MIKNTMSNFLKSILIIALLISIPKITFGADLFIKTPKEEYKIGEQFIVSVEVVSEKEMPINAMDLRIGFTKETLKFVNSMERNSIISFFVDRPRVENGDIFFSGITPGGFYGVIDPIVDPEKVQTVKIIDLIFEPIREGRAEVYLEEGSLYRADGTGLTLNFTDWPKIVSVTGDIFESKIDLNDEFPPLPFEMNIFKDKNISKNSILVFETSDEESGIDYYEIYEEGRKPQISNSPYILKNKPPRGVITVKAYDKAGNVQVSYIDAPIVTENDKNSKDIILIVAIICILSLLVFFRKNKKKLLA
jgi:hypothetical protein